MEVEVLAKVTSSLNYISVLGPIWDIAGAVLVTRALVFVPFEAIAFQSGAFWNYNARLMRMFAEQMIDGAFGLFMFTVGFSLQTAVGFGLSATDSWCLVLGAVALAAALGLYLALRHRLTRAVFFRAARTFTDKNGEHRYADTDIERQWGFTERRTHRKASDEQRLGQ